MIRALRMSRPSSVRRRALGPGGRVPCPGSRRLSREATGREPIAGGPRIEASRRAGDEGSATDAQVAWRGDADRTDPPHPACPGERPGRCHPHRRRGAGPVEDAQPQRERHPLRAGPRAFHQPGALLARVRGPAARPGRGRAGPSARAGQVPGHLLRGPRRVLPGPGGRSEGPGRRRPAGPVGRRTAAERGAAGHRGPGVGVGGPAVPHLRRRDRTGAGRRRDPALGLVVARRRRPRLPGRRLPTADLPRPHAAVGRPRSPLSLHLEPVAQPHRPRR